MDEIKLPKREDSPNLNDYLEAVSKYNQATSKLIVHEIPNVSKDLQDWLRFNDEFSGKIIVVKHFTQQDVDDLRYLAEIAFDGACVSDYDEQVIERVNRIADKIQEMV
jgi:hypothetical protein